MVTASFAFGTSSIAEYSITGKVRDPYDRARISQSYGFVGSDKKPFGIQLSNIPRFWEALTNAVERPDLATDPQYVDHAGRVANYERIRSVLSQIFASRPREYWLERLRGADVPVAEIKTVPEALDDLQVIANQGLVSVPLGDGRARIAALPIRFGEPEAPATEPRPVDGVAQLGQHTEAVLAELGYTPDELSALRAEKTI
jgi:formyl-CoA transferase